MRIVAASLLLLIGGAAVCFPATVTVFAAASLTDSLTQIASDYKNKGGDEIVFNFAGSSLLARQIEEGAPADLFFSADDRLMNGLESKGLIVKGTRANRLSNTLVVIVPQESAVPIKSADDLAGPAVGRVALADPQAVPAGVYARQYLEKKHLWAAVGPKVVPTANVRAALAAVASGNAEAGMVYKTDAAISGKVKIACEIPAEAGPNINYPVALMAGAEHAAAARRFLEYLESPAAGRVFARFGFMVRDGTP